MKPKHENQVDWEMIAAQLPKGWRALAIKMGLIRERPAQLGAKITDIEQVLRPVLHHVTGASLRMTTAASAAAGLVVLSAVALHKWMRKLGPYLAELLQRMLATEQFAAERWAGYRIVAADATCVQRPGASGTTARVHYALTLPDLGCRHCEVTDETGGESARRFSAEPDELWTLDRAYANPPGIAWLHSQGAAVLVRYNRGSLPIFDRNEKPLSILNVVRWTFDAGQPAERPVVVHAPDGTSIAGRLCWVRLPEDKAAQARERVRRESDGKPDALSMRLAGLVIVFTTVPASRMTTDLVLELYRARWQIELEFKRDKTIGDLDLLPNFRADTIHTWICANLLLQAIARKIATPTNAFPPGALREALLSTPTSTLPRAARTRTLVRQGADLVGGVQRAPAAQPPRHSPSTQRIHRPHQAIQ